ncbi:MAG: glycosyltransferase family 4 protein [Solirubrobacteraceae bacterium]
MLLENNPYPQDTRVRNEAESLTAAGYAVTVIAPREAGQPRTERLNGVVVTRYRTLWAAGSALSYGAEYGIAHVQLIARALIALARGARVLHLHGPPDTLFLAGIVARAAGRAFVFDLHDSAPELFQAKFGDSAAALAILRAAQRQAIRWASHVIVTNETQRELARSRGAIDPRHISVVRNGPRSAEFRDPPLARGGSLDAVRLVYVGTLDTQDGVLELPELLQMPVLSGARLTVIGDGPLHAPLLARCRELGLDGRVTFTGRLPHAEIPQLIAEADMGIDPAQGSELNHGSTMIKVVEYMGAGRPLVAYDLRETRRSAGDAALYAPCGDRLAFAALIAELARDAPRRISMGHVARARALELMMWDRSADVLRDAYAQLKPRQSGSFRRRAQARAQAWR